MCAALFEANRKYFTQDEELTAERVWDADAEDEIAAMFRYWSLYWFFTQFDAATYRMEVLA